MADNWKYTRGVWEKIEAPEEWRDEEDDVEYMRRIGYRRAWSVDASVDIDDSILNVCVPEDESVEYQYMVVVDSTPYGIPAVIWVTDFPSYLMLLRELHPYLDLQRMAGADADERDRRKKNDVYKRRG